MHQALLAIRSAHRPCVPRTRYPETDFIAYTPRQATHSRIGQIIRIQHEVSYTLTACRIGDSSPLYVPNTLGCFPTLRSRCFDAVNADCITDTFPRLVVNGKSEDKDWSATRRTKNADTKQGLNSPTVADIRCYSSQTAPNVMEVPAGATVHWVASQQMNHPGPTQYYLAKVPEGSSATKWDGSGNVWFKFHTTTATIDVANQMTWPNQSKISLYQ